MSAIQLATRPLRPVGGEVLDLVPGCESDPEFARAVYEAWLAHGILLFRNVESLAQHIALSRCLGELEIHPIVEARAKEDPLFIEIGGSKPSLPIVYDGVNLRINCVPWHRDTAFTPAICKGAMLRMLEIPQLEGETLLADTAAAYNGLPQEMKDRLETLEYVASCRYGNTDTRPGNIWKTPRDATEKEFPSGAERQRQRDILMEMFGSATPTKARSCARAPPVIDASAASAVCFMKTTRFSTTWTGSISRRFRTSIRSGRPTGYYNVNGAFVSAPVTLNNPNVRPLGDGFFDDITRGYTQKAAYASVDFDLIPETLTLTAGTRYSSTNTWEVGSTVGSFGCQLINFPNAPNPCVNEPNYQDFINLNSENLNRTYSGFIGRANLSWKVSEDALLYYTWSQGFRAGGFNRKPIEPVSNSPLAAGPNPWQAQALQHEGWVGAVAFAPDGLTNNELRWKTLWMDRRIQWNGTIYQEDWKHAQINVGVNGLSSNGVTLNGGNYRVRGVETSLVARLSSGFTLVAGAAWNQSELVKQATFLWQDGTPIDFSALQTPSGQKVSNPGGALGSPLAGAPPFQSNIRARYEFPFNGYDAFAQIGAVHQSHSLSATDPLSLDLQGNSIAYDLPAFTTYDGALGVGKDAWLVQVYGENLTDTRAELYANDFQWYKAITVSRPRTIGLRFSYKFSGK